MSEENTTIEDSIEDSIEETTEAPATTADANPVGPTQLTVGDLKTMVRVIQVGANRGAYNAEELEAVGKLYKNIVNFLAEGGHITITDTPPVNVDAPKDNVEEVAEEPSAEMMPEEIEGSAPADETTDGISVADNEEKE